MKKLLLSIGIIATLFTSCTKQKNVSPITPVVPPIDTTHIVDSTHIVDTTWYPSNHNIDIIYNNSKYSHNIFGSFTYYKNGVVVYQSRPVDNPSHSSYDMPYYRITNLEKNDSISVILDGYTIIDVTSGTPVESENFSQVDIVYNGTVVASDTGHHQIRLSYVVRN